MLDGVLLIRLTEDLSRVQQTEIAELAAESTARGMDALKSKYGWPLRQAKSHVMHLAHGPAECHRCGRALSGSSNPVLCRHCRSLNIRFGWQRIDEGEAVVRLEGWNHGLEKVSTTNAFKDFLGLCLKAAHALITEKLLSLTAPLHVGPVPEGVARDLATNLQQLGATCSALDAGQQR